MVDALDLLLLLFGAVFRQKILNYVLEEETTRHLERRFRSHTLPKKNQEFENQLQTWRSKFTLPKSCRTRTCYFLTKLRVPSMTKLEAAATVTCKSPSTQRFRNSNQSKYYQTLARAHTPNDAFGSWICDKLNWFTSIGCRFNIDRGDRQGPERYRPPPRGNKRRRSTISSCVRTQCSFSRGRSPAQAISIRAAYCTPAAVHRGINGGKDGQNVFFF